jgi:hypothetical protein
MSRHRSSINWIFPEVIEAHQSASSQQLLTAACGLQQTASAYSRMNIPRMSHQRILCSAPCGMRKSPQPAAHATLVSSKLSRVHGAAFSQISLKGARSRDFGKPRLLYRAADRPRELTVTARNVIVLQTRSPSTPHPPTCGKASHARARGTEELRPRGTHS